MKDDSLILSKLCPQKYKTVAFIFACTVSIMETNVIGSISDKLIVINLYLFEPTTKAI